MKYKKRVIEAFPPKKKLCLLQNAVGDVTYLYINQIDDQYIAKALDLMTFESNMELLLLTC
jgi:hypothetical protein